MRRSSTSSERNNTYSSSSDYFICRKVRAALASCPGFRAISNRLSQQRQEPKTVAIDSKSPPSSSPSPVTTIDIEIQIKPTEPQPQLPQVISEESEVIPIKFDYSTPPHVGKKNLNEIFTRYIESTKEKIGRASNGDGGSDRVEAVPDGEANNDHDMKKKDNLNKKKNKKIVD